MDRNEQPLNEIEDIKFGERHTVISVKGRLFSAGNNSYGQLGIELKQSLETTLVKYSRVSQLAVGSFHSALININNDKIYTWGDKNCGKLGQGITTVSEYKGSSVPKRLKGLS